MKGEAQTTTLPVRAAGSQKEEFVYRTMKDFFDVYGSLTEGTRKIFGVLTDENLDQAVTREHRTLGQLAWHVVTTLPEMTNRTGLGVASIDPASMPPSSAKEISAAYTRVTDELVRKLEAEWDDKTLLETDDMYGESWPRGKTLHALVAHEAHHVGQMTVLLRQAGARVPGIYGPSKEEWGQFGMEPPAY
ncbi:MAG: hypothetical protein H6Q78_1521 [Candidatus Krumholzibacteriota bacterium]|nr:hypothetical protein [Candidatus Krumholzibacteriota bacterium]